MCLKPDQLLHWHATVCSQCKSYASGTPDPGCYFSRLWLCVVIGWNPPFLQPTFTPPYKVSGNYKTADDYSDSVTSEQQSILDLDVVKECTELEGQVVHPLGAVVKSSDKTRAMVKTGTKLLDSASLDVS